MQEAVGELTLLAEGNVLAGHDKHLARSLEAGDAEEALSELHSRHGFEGSHTLLVLRGVQRLGFFDFLSLGKLLQLESRFCLLNIL